MKLSNYVHGLTKLNLNPFFCVKRGCLLVRQSFFHDDSKNFIDVGGGVTGVRGFHSSFRLTQGGLSLNMGRNALIFLYLS
jgi:hypothetical protein